MRCEDLFIAIGEVDEKCLARCEIFRTPSRVTQREELQMKHGKRMNKVWLIAAIVALMVLLMGSAIAALVKMDVQETKVLMQEETVVEGETVIVEKIYEGEKISFDKVHDEFIELGNFYPQQIPDGYKMTFVSNDAPLQHRVIDYENDAGNVIKFWVYLGDPASVIEVYEIESKTEVDVNGQKGVLYEQKGDTRTLVWADEDRGYGFALRTDDAAVPILPMAKSVAEGEALMPTNSEETVKALEELGDFSPQYLPEGFEELNVQGWPKMEDSWYSYVRKWYVNKAENTGIYFEYETYSIVTEDGYTDDARTVCSFYMRRNQRGEVIGQEVEINGMFGFMDQDDIVWADPETHQVYHLHSEDVTGEQLLKVAQGVCEKP